MSDEHRTDGWEPDLPVSDTLLRRFLFNLAAFHEVPAAAAGAAPAPRRWGSCRSPASPSGTAPGPPGPASPS
jgi:hypothetical protein